MELVACVKIRSGTEAVSMSATEDLSVDATRGTVRAHWGIGCIWAQGARAGDPLIFLSVEQNNKVASVSQSVSYFTVPPRAHPSTGSQSGSATPGLTQRPSTRPLDKLI